MYRTSAIHHHRSHMPSLLGITFWETYINIYIYHMHSILQHIYIYTPYYIAILILSCFLLPHAFLVEIDFQSGTTISG